MIREYKNLTIKDYTKDFNTCDCCGKQNLAGTMTVVDVNGNVFHYGTTCAYAADKYDTLEAAMEAKKEVQKIIRKEKKQYENKLRCLYNQVTYSPELIQLRKEYNLYPVKMPAIHYGNDGIYCMENKEYAIRFNELWNEGLTKIN